MLKLKNGYAAFLTLGLLVIGVFFLVVLFGPSIGGNLGTLSEKKSEQASEAKGKPGGYADSSNQDCGSVNSSANIAVGETKTYSLYCTVSTKNLGVYVSWGKADSSKDLELRVIQPDGSVLTADNDPNAGESLWAYQPIQMGTYKVEVVNQGTASVKYDLLVGFGN